MCRVLNDQVRKYICSITFLVLGFLENMLLDLNANLQLGNGETSYLLKHNLRAGAPEIGRSISR